jgi:hypothetical protein
MERRFWIITLVFFTAVTICFLLIVSQQLSGIVTPAIASGSNQQSTSGMSSGKVTPSYIQTTAPSANSGSLVP